MRKELVAAACLLGTMLSGCAAPSIEFEEPKPTLRLVGVRAVSTTLGSNTDDVYFAFSDGSRFPAESHVIRTGDVWRPSIVLDATKSGSVQLFEADSITSDDLIGTFNYNRNESGTYRQTMTGDGSRYELIWVVRVE
jgi:hypothetical protein